jgi:hypothetical protein
VIVATSKIFSALSAHLRAQDPNTPIAWPNVNFVPPVETVGNNKGRFKPYFSVSFLPSRVVNSEIRYGKAPVTGIFQVSVYGPSNAGILQVSALADNVIGYFNPGLVIANNDVVVRINEEPWQAGALLESNDLVQVPVTIPWIVFAD